jgi:hypothetical protein
MGFLYPIEYLGTQAWLPRSAGSRMVKQIRTLSAEERRRYRVGMTGENELGEVWKIVKSPSGSIDRLTYFKPGAKLNSVIESIFGGTSEAKGLALGKIGTKKEPGKVRVFAMVDFWTQCLLTPLHDWAFKILMTIPQDGTFNQLKPLKGLVDIMKRRGLKKSWSFDLSAATDRFPLWIQRSLLSQVFSERFGTLWARLLVGRKYAIRRKGVLAGSVTYRTGQPMGALSSWAIFSLSHHLVVQWCAWRVGFNRWFTLYALLGDDIVIADEKVAKEYMKVMDALGVKIGLAKSLVGQDLSMEFAKRFVYKGQDVSPISLKEYHVSKSHMPSLNELIPKVQSLVEIRLCHVLKALGFGYKAVSRMSAKYVKLSKRLSQAILLLTAPSAPFGYCNGLQWFQSVGYGLIQPWSSEERDGLMMSLATKGVTHLFTAIQLIEYRLEMQGEVPDNLPDPFTGRRTLEPLAHAATGGKTKFELKSEADAVGPWSLAGIIPDWRTLVEFPCFEWVKGSLLRTKKASAALRATCRALLNPACKGEMLTTYLEQVRALQLDLARYPKDMTLLYRPGIQSGLPPVTRDLVMWKSLKRNQRKPLQVVRVSTKARIHREWT